MVKPQDDWSPPRHPERPDEIFEQSYDSHPNLEDRLRGDLHRILNLINTKHIYINHYRQLLFDLLRVNIIGRGSSE